MLASQSVSTEIWQIILRYAISVPDFLDPDAFEGILSDFLCNSDRCDRNNEAAYWRAERQRNTLQCVCSSWYLYLRPFEHRYVRMLDLWHETIPPTALKKATRVSLARENCTCTRFCIPALKRRAVRCRARARCRDARSLLGENFFLRFCEIIFLETCKLDSLLIVDTKGEQLAWYSAHDLSRNNRRIKVVLGIDSEEKNHGIMEYLVPLKELSTLHGHGQWTIWPHWTDCQPIFSNLVTLSLVDSPYLYIERVATEINLPSLCHLRIDNPLREADDNKTFMSRAVGPLLQSKGQNLQSLYLISPYSEYELAPVVWEFCPRLKRLCTTMRLASPPPISHPLDTRIVLPQNVAREEAGFLRWPNLQRIVVDGIWSDTLRGDQIPSHWRRICAERNTRIEDQNGTTWKESLLLCSRVSSLTENINGPPAGETRWRAIRRKIGDLSSRNRKVEL